MTAMDYEFMGHCRDGINFGLEAYGVPLRYQARLINRYWYYTIGPVAASPAELEFQGRRSRERLEAAMGRIGELWSTEWLPEVKRHLAYWEAFDLPGASAAALFAHLEETVARSRRVWAIHFLQTFPTYIAMSEFDELYRDLFGADGAFDAYRLLQGFDNKTVEIGRARRELGRRALAAPALREIFNTRAAGEIVAALEGSTEGRALLAQLRAHLNEYGQRGEKLGVSFPSFLEDPTPVIEDLKDYVGQTDRDVSGEMEALAAERERLVAMARERLAGHPQTVAQRFEFLLRAAQESVVLTEDHTYWIDFQCMYEVRRVLLELGQRLATMGTLDRPEDIFHLTVDELRDTFASSRRINRRPLVAGRRAEIEYF